MRWHRWPRTPLPTCRSYRMICKATWPSVKGGDARTATELIVRQEKFEADCVYGKTMLFIRSPHTVHALEARRAQCIPPLIVLLQKVLHFYENERTRRLVL